MNAIAFVVLASVAAASAGLLGAPLAIGVPAATYSTSGARISQSVRPLSYAAAPVAAYHAAPAYAQAVQYPVAHAVAAPVASYATSGLRISQSVRPVSYAAPAYAQGIQYASPVHHAIAAPAYAAHPAVGVATVSAVPHAIGYGYTPALSTLLG